MESRFLDLLLHDAPVEAFQQVLAEARSAGTDADTLAELETAQVSALEVRALLDSYRRRERELAALYETAGDLTSLRDVGRVLQAIVRRGRQLLGSDVSYLMLIDEARGDTYMRVTEGTVSADFEHVRLNLGAGLGGLVAATSSPYYTTDYFEDSRFDHQLDVDDAVGAEGLVAILGVPLHVGDRVIGVLFAANRRARPFAAEEVALLGSLAAHAAIAIENARLFQETREAVRDLARARERVQAHSDAVERASAAHERLTTVAVRGGGIGDVAEAVVELLGGCLLVVDAEMRLLARVDAGLSETVTFADSGEVIDEATRSAVARALGTGATQQIGSQPGTDRPWVTPIVAGSERLGALLLQDGGQLDDADRRTLERAALVSALVLLHERTLAEAEQRMRGELIGELLDRRVGDDERLHRRAHLIGLDLAAEHNVVAATPRADERRQAAVAMAAIAREMSGIAGEHRGDVVLLVPGATASSTARQVWGRLRAHLDGPATVGAGGPVRGADALPGAHADAVRCVRTLVALGRSGTAASAQELGAYALVLSQTGGDELHDFVERTLGPVLAYDTDRGASLLPTLEAYFACSGNVARAARQLHIHVNTIRQRLARLDDLLGPRWRDGDAALQLHLAVRLRHLEAKLAEESERRAGA